ncbi:MAG TPA: CbiX/SirB N-terminal domain-containing protein [Dermatophilaceae bacterium]|nr:CbiX/SirB N-terminal domain-containing protein [Dermatophilaceae bacterium]
MTGPGELDVVLLAHGSPDPRHRQGVEELAARVRRLAPPIGVHPAYLDHHAPSPVEVAAHATRGLAVVPVLLTPAYHARVDVPQAVAEMALVTAHRVQATPPLGPDPLLVAAAEELLGQAGVAADPDTAVVLFAAGSSDSAAVASIEETLTGCRPKGPWGPWRVAALDGGLALDAVLASLGGQASQVVAVAFMVAEGILRDRQAARCGAAGVDLVDGALCRTDALAELVLRRVGAIA